MQPMDVRTDALSDSIALRHRLPVAVLGLALGVLLVSLALPRLIGELILVPTRTVLADLDARRDVSRARLEAVVRAAGSAARWIESGRVYGNQALAELLLARDGDTVDRDLLERSAAHARQSLALAPHNPFVWARLAAVTAALDPANASGQTTAALLMSVRVGPFVRDLVLSRCEVILASWRGLSPADRATLAPQFAAALQIAPQRFVQAVSRAGLEIEVGEALHGNGAAARTYLRELVRQRRGSAAARPVRAAPPRG